MRFTEWAWRGFVYRTRWLRQAYRQGKRLTGAITDRRVDFMIVGTQKGGTTALDEYLRPHPEICMAQEKEPHFFNQDRHFRNGAPDYAPYQAFFSPKPRHKLIGEATPSYMYFPDVPARLKEYNPDLKLIALLRDPIARAYSQWNMDRRARKRPRPFGEAIRAEQRARENGTMPPRGPEAITYIHRGFYSEQLERLWQHFPREQTLILRNEELRDRPRETLDRVCSFLGVPPLAEVKHREALASSYKSPMNEADRAFLREVFEPEVRRLEALLGWDLGGWLTSDGSATAPK